LLQKIGDAFIAGGHRGISTELDQFLELGGSAVEDGVYCEAAASELLAQFKEISRRRLAGKNMVCDGCPAR
jgi:hypothetical protein